MPQGLPRKHRHLQACSRPSSRPNSPSQLIATPWMPRCASFPAWVCEVIHPTALLKYTPRRFCPAHPAMYCQMRPTQSTINKLLGSVLVKHGLPGPTLPK